MPPTFMMDDGNEIKASTYQAAVWVDWLDYWGIVAQRAAGRRVWIIVDGDLCDAELFNGGGAQTLSRQVADAVKCAQIVMRPALSIAERWFFVRGTEAHAGKANVFEELAAMQMNATPDPENGNRSWKWLPLECEGVTFDIAHHPATFGTRWWTKRAAVARESNIIASAYIERGERVPDMAVRGHYHFAGDSGAVEKPRVLFVPSWSLSTAYVFKRNASELRDMGGWIVECDAGRCEPEFIRYRPKRREPWSESRS
jgi:hypothetical protein